MSIWRLDGVDYAVPPVTGPRQRICSSHQLRQSLQSSDVLVRGGWRSSQMTTTLPRPWRMRRLVAARPTPWVQISPLLGALCRLAACVSHIKDPSGCPKCTCKLGQPRLKWACVMPAPCASRLLHVQCL